jgi:hypothetical protein
MESHSNVSKQAAAAQPSTPAVCGLCRAEAFRPDRPNPHIVTEHWLQQVGVGSELTTISVGQPLCIPCHARLLKTATQRKRERRLKNNQARAQKRVDDRRQAEERAAGAPPHLAAPHQPLKMPSEPGKKHKRGPYGNFDDVSPETQRTRLRELADATADVVANEAKRLRLPKGTAVASMTLLVGKRSYILKSTSAAVEERETSALAD